MSMRYPGFVALCLYLVLSLSPASAADEQDLLAFVCARHAETIASFRTVHCLMARRHDPAPRAGSQETGCEYWRSLDSIRARAFGLRETDKEYLVKGSRLTTLYHNVRGESRSSVAPYEGLIEDPFAEGLLAFSRLDPPGLVALDELLAKPHRINGVKRVSNGRDLIYLDFSHDRFRFEIFFDPQVNYLVRKLIQTSNTARTRRESEIVKFAEVRPAVYFPARIETKVFEAAGALRSTRVATISDIQVNQPMDPGIFKFRYPDGTIVQDLFTRTIYKTDTEGRNMGPVVDSTGRVRQMGRGRPLSGALVGQEPQRATQEEPTSWLPWIVASASLIVLCVAGFLWFVRRRRQFAEAVG